VALWHKIPAEEVDVPGVSILCFQALFDWHTGEVASCDATMAEALAVARNFNDMHGLAVTLWHAGWLAYFERKTSEVERYASELLELSTRHGFALWLAGAEVLSGWARSALDDTTEGISWIDRGIQDMRAIGVIRGVPGCLLLKAEALDLADRSREALVAIEEAVALAEKFEERWCCAELHRLRGVFLASVRADEAEVETSIHAAVDLAKEQKSLSLQKRAEETYAEYWRQKTTAVGGQAVRLVLS
jgi:hypothetical protein